MVIRAQYVSMQYLFVFVCLLQKWKVNLCNKILEEVVSFSAERGKERERQKVTFSSFVY